MRGPCTENHYNIGAPCRGCGYDPNVPIVRDKLMWDGVPITLFVGSVDKVSDTQLNDVNNPADYSDLRDDLTAARSKLRESGKTVMRVSEERNRLRNRVAELEGALGGLFEHCSMIHKHWGDGSNAKEAASAVEVARAALASRGKL